MDSLILREDWPVRRGDDAEQALSLADADGLPVPFTGATAEEVWHPPGEPHNPVLELASGTDALVLHADDGIIERRLTAAVTAALPPGDYTRFTRVQWPGGKLETVSQGIATVFDT